MADCNAWPVPPVPEDCGDAPGAVLPVLLALLVVLDKDPEPVADWEVREAGALPVPVVVEAGVLAVVDDADGDNLDVEEPVDGPFNVRLAEAAAETPACALWI